MVSEAETEFLFFQGGLNFIFVLISILLGLKIFSKYFEYKRKELLTFGISIIFGTSIWWYSAFYEFFGILFGIYQPSLFLNNLSSIIGIVSFVFWIYTYSLVVYPKSVKKIMIITLAIICPFAIYFFISIIINPESSLDTRGFLISDKLPLILIVYIISLVISGVISTLTLFHFIILLIKSDDSEMIWKGRFLLIGWILGFIGLFIAFSFPVSLTVSVIVRIFLISSRLGAYIGWLMPERVAKWLIKDYQKSSEEPKEQDDDIQEFLRILSKRRDITEKEISFYREQKICLVCKGKVIRFNNYICPECDALYCNKCALALVDLENMCWVCNTPFDESKPVKPFKKEEVKVEITKTAQKKPKND